MPPDGKSTSSDSTSQADIFKSIAAEAPQGIIVIQGDKVLYANAKLSKLIGFPLKEIYKWKTRDFIKYVFDADRGDTAPRLKTAIKGEVKTRLYQLRIKNKEGEILWFQVLPRAIKVHGEAAILAIIIDITETKQTELAYQELVDHSLQGIIIIQDGRVVYSNQAFADMSGYSIEEILTLSPKQVQERVHPDYQARVWGRLKDRLEGKQVPSHYSFKAIRKDGEERWMELYATVIDFDGRPAVQATLLDITERQEADIKLQESEARYRTLFNDVPVGLYRTTPEGEIVDANPALLRILGASDREALLKLNAADFYVDVDEREQWHGVKEQTTIIQGHETQFRRIDDKIIWVRDSFQAVKDDEGNNLYFEGTLEDITERKRAEHALKESEERYRTLVDTSPDSITLTDLEGTIIMANQQALKMYGVKDEKELYGISAFDLIAKEDVPRAIENMQKTLKEGTSGTLEYTLLRANGTPYPAELNASLLKDAEGNPLAFIGVIRDISERKEAEARYRSLFDSVPVGLFRSTPDGDIVDVNPALVELLGFEEKEPLLKRKALSFYINPEDRKQWELIVAREDVVTGVQTQFRREDNKVIWVELAARAIRDSDGNILHYEGTLKDITDRKQAEEALRESEAKYRVVIEQSLQGYVIFQNERVIFANSRILEILHVSLEEIQKWTPSDIWEVVHPDDRPILQQRLQDRFSGKPVPDRYEFRIQQEDGTITWLDVDIHLIDYQGNIAIQAALMDVTERKLADEAIRESEAKFRNVVEQSLQGIVISQGIPPRIYFANEAFCDMIGYTIEELLAMPPKKVKDMIHPADRELVLQRVNDRLKGKPAPQQYEYRMLRKDGAILWVEVFATLIEFEGAPAIQAAYVDITERKEAEAALQESEEKFRALVEELSDWVWEMDLQGKILYSNNAVEDILGFSAGQVVGRTPCDFLRPEDVNRAQQTFNELKEKKRPIRTLVIKFVHRDESDVMLEARGRPVLDEQGELIGFRGICRDITDRLKMIEQLRHLEEGM